MVSMPWFLLPRLRAAVVTTVAVLAVVTTPVRTLAQAPPPAPVRYTEAIRHLVRPTVRLPGTVEARTGGPIATEVAGLVASIQAREGDRVAKGDPLVSLRTDNLKLAVDAGRAALQEAEARRDRATRDLERATGLHEDHLVSDGDLDQARAEALAWEGRAAKLKADLARAELDLRRSVIRAPFAGTVVAKRVDLGAWIAVGSPVVDLLASDALEVRVEVPDRYYPALRSGEPATVTIDTDPPIAVVGTISAIVPRADVRSRVFPVKVRLTGEAPILAGMLATVEIPVGAGQPALLVPKDALVPRGPASIVYVLAEDGTAAAVTVTPGKAAGNWIAVAGELQAGDKVIVRGNERIFPGQTFRGEPLEYPLP